MFSGTEFIRIAMAEFHKNHQPEKERLREIKICQLLILKVLWRILKYLRQFPASKQHQMNMCHQAVRESEEGSSEHQEDKASSIQGSDSRLVENNNHQCVVNKDYTHTHQQG